MIQILVPGQNIPAPGVKFAVKFVSRAPADFSAFLLKDSGKTAKDEDFIFYGQTQRSDGGVKLFHQAAEGFFEIDPAKLPADIAKIAFAVTCDAPDLSNAGPISVSLSAYPNEFAASWQELCQARAETAGRKEAALILCELYKRNGAWKFRFVDQGFNGGLKPLAEHFGVKITDEPKPEPQFEPEPEPKPQPKQEPKVSLSKVTLTKRQPSVRLEKTRTEGGIWKVNLNWNQVGKITGFLSGLFGKRETAAIDLDLGACVRMKDGSKDIVQAVGGNFGSTKRFPWVQLMGDDRTGENADGEWLLINGDMIDSVRDIFIFAFIYEGVPNWNATDGVVRVFIPGQPEIETKLEGENSRLNMCAVARIISDGGHVTVEKLDRYFRGHVEMDDAFGWGFSWTRGRK